MDEESPGTKSRSCASARLRSLRPCSDPLRRAAEDLELSSSTRRLGGAGMAPPSSLLSRVSPCRASRSTVHIFLRFFFLSGCVHRDFFLLSQKAPPLPQDNQLLRAQVPLRGALVR